MDQSCPCERYLIDGVSCDDLWSAKEWFGGIDTRLRLLKLCEEHVHPALSMR